MSGLRRLFHRHEWEDAFAFDSCFEITIPYGPQRVVARAMMMRCRTCSAMQRRALPFDAALTPKDGE